MVELIWDGKYDATGKRVAPLRLKLPIRAREKDFEQPPADSTTLQPDANKPTMWARSVSGSSSQDGLEER